MSEVEVKVVRRGASAARRAARAAPLPENLRPVRPGMPGGRYTPLSDAEVLRIHRAALDVLENIGLADATPGGIEYMTKAGAKMTPAGRLIFPRALVEDTVARAARRFVLHGQDANTTWNLGILAFISAPREPRCTSSMREPASIVTPRRRICTTSRVSSIPSTTFISINVP